MLLYKVAMIWPRRTLHNVGNHFRSAAHTGVQVVGEAAKIVVPALGASKMALDNYAQIRGRIDASRRTKYF